MHISLDTSDSVCKIVKAAEKVPVWLNTTAYTKRIFSLRVPKKSITILILITHCLLEYLEGISSAVALAHLTYFLACNLSLQMTSPG